MIVFRVVCGWVWFAFEAAWTSGGGAAVTSAFCSASSCAVEVVLLSLRQRGRRRGGVVELRLHLLVDVHELGHRLLDVLVGDVVPVCHGPRCGELLGDGRIGRRHGEVDAVARRVGHHRRHVEELVARQAVGGVRLELRGVHDHGRRKLRERRFLAGDHEVGDRGRVGERRVLHRPRDAGLRRGRERDRRQELRRRLVLRRLVLGVGDGAHGHQHRHEKHDPLPAGDHAEVVAQRNRLIPSCFHRWILSGRLRSSRAARSEKLGTSGAAAWVTLIDRGRICLAVQPWPPTPMVPPSI